MKLTEAEREALFDDALAFDNIHTPWAQDLIAGKVERIIAARMEALFPRRAAVAADPAVEVGLRGPGDRDARWRIVARDLRVPPPADTTR